MTLRVFYALEQFVMNLVVPCKLFVEEPLACCIHKKKKKTKQQHQSVKASRILQLSFFRQLFVEI